MAHKGEKSNGSHYAAGRTGIVQKRSAVAKAKALAKLKKLVAEKKRKAEIKKRIALIRKAEMKGIKLRTYKSYKSKSS